MPRKTPIILLISLIFSLIPFYGQSQTENCKPLWVNFNVNQSKCGIFRFTCEILQGSEPNFYELVVNGVTYNTMDTVFKFISRDRKPDSIVYSIHVKNDCSNFKDQGKIINDYYPFAALANAQIDQCSRANFSFNLHELKHYPELVIWEGDDGFTAVNNWFPTHTYSHPGRFKYSLKVIENGGCDTSIYLGNVLIENDLEVIAGEDLFLCPESQPVKLEGMPYGGVWEGNGVKGNFFYPDLAGIGQHLLTYTYQTGGCIDVDVVNYSVAIPDAQIADGIFEGEAPFTTSFLTTTEQPQLEYIWNFGDPDDSQNEAQGSKVSHTFNNAGTYQVQLTVRDSKSGCYSQPATIPPMFVRVSKTEVSSIAFRNRLNIHANPGQQMIEIFLDKPNSSPAHLKISNLEGKIIQDFITSSNIVQLNTQFMQPGMYVFMFESDDNEMYCSKFHVMRP